MAKKRKGESKTEVTVKQFLTDYSDLIGDDTSFTFHEYMGDDNSFLREDIPEKILKKKVMCAYPRFIAGDNSKTFIVVTKK